MSIIDYTVVRRKVEEFFDEEFSMVPIEKENTRINVDKTPAYISLTDISGDAESLGIGMDAFKVTGAFVIQIFTPLGKGTEQSRSIASSLADLLNNKDLSGFTFLTPELNAFGQVEDADYYQLNLTVPYVFAYGADEPSC